MKLLIVLMCLLSERYLQHQLANKRFTWFVAYGQTLEKHLSPYRWLRFSWVMLSLLLLPMVLVVALILHFCTHLLYGSILYVLSLLIFYMCLGPQNAFYPKRQTAMQDNNPTEVSCYLADVNGSLFAVVFWYFLLGPLGVVVYRMISMARELPIAKPAAVILTNLLDWLPARVTALLYLLVGNFKDGYVQYSQAFFSAPSNNRLFLSKCGSCAMGTVADDHALLPEAERLVAHGVILLLVCLALLTLVALI